MIKIIGISGSVRKKSLNKALLHEAKNAMPNGSQLDILSIAEIPLYNGDDEEAHGVPDSAEKIKKAISEADALLIVTPEYNHSIPGVLKNALDWLTRPPKDIPKVFNNRIVSLMGATPSWMGTLNAHTAWLTIFRTLGMHPWFGESLFISEAHKKFDDNNQLTDKETKEKLEKYLQSFVEYVQEKCK